MDRLEFDNQERIMIKHRIVTSLDVGRVVSVLAKRNSGTGGQVESGSQEKRDPPSSGNISTSVGERLARPRLRQTA